MQVCPAWVHTPYKLHCLNHVTPPHFLYFIFIVDILKLLKGGVYFGSRGVSPMILAVPLVPLIKWALTCSCLEPISAQRQSLFFSVGVTDTLLLSLSWELCGECLLCVLWHSSSHLGRNSSPDVGGSPRVLAGSCTSGLLQGFPAIPGADVDPCQPAPHCPQKNIYIPNTMYCPQKWRTKSA